MASVLDNTLPLAEADPPVVEDGSEEEAVLSDRDEDAGDGRGDHRRNTRSGGAVERKLLSYLEQLAELHADLANPEEGVTPAPGEQRAFWKQLQAKMNEELSLLKNGRYFRCSCS